MKKILGISLVAMMAVTTANAEIASKAYVDVSGEHPIVSASNTTGTNIGALADAIGTPDEGKTIVDMIGEAQGDAAALIGSLSDLTTAEDSNVVAAINELDSTKQNASTAVTHTESAAVGSTTQPVYVANNGAVTASNATVGSATQTVYLNAGTITAGTQLGGAAEKGVDTDFTNTSSTNLPTTSAVATYVSTQAAATNFVHDGTISSSETAKAPSEKAVYDALALKQNKAIGAAPVNNEDSADKDEILVVGADGNIANSGTKIGTAAGANVSTGVGAAGVGDGESGLVSGDQVYEYVSGAITTAVGTDGAVDDAIDTKIGALTGVNSGTGNVVTAVSEASGIVTATYGNAILQTDSVTTNGTHVLTMTRTGAGTTESPYQYTYGWEAITLRP